MNPANLSPTHPDRNRHHTDGYYRDYEDWFNSWFPPIDDPRINDLPADDKPIPPVPF